MKPPYWLLRPQIPVSEPNPVWSVILSSNKKKKEDIHIFLPTQPNCSATPLPGKKRKNSIVLLFLANSLEICFMCRVLIVRWISEYNLKSSVFEINISIQLIVTYLINQCLELCFRSVRTREAILAINCLEK